MAIFTHIVNWTWPFSTNLPCLPQDLWTHQTTQMLLHTQNRHWKNFLHNQNQASRWHFDFCPGFIVKGFCSWMRGKWLMLGYRVGFECFILRYAIGSWQGKRYVGLCDFKAKRKGNYRWAWDQPSSTLVRRSLLSKATKQVGITRKV